MARMGFEVDVFEALHEVGGVLKYGIPEFRLPNSVVDAELDALRAMGVRFHTDIIIGKTITYDELQRRGYRGIFVASGAGLPRFMGVPGENFCGVLSSNEYLTRINLMGAGRDGHDTPASGAPRGRDRRRQHRHGLRPHRPPHGRREGNDNLPPQRGRDARAEEVLHAKEEGVEFVTLANPVEYLADERGHVRAVRVQRMRLGEPDASGRRSPEPIPGAVDEIEIDLAIVSVGVSPNPLIPNSIDGLDVTQRGTVAVDGDLCSSIPMLYAGGDIVRGGATVILAMGDGRRAAGNMAARLLNK